MVEASPNLTTYSDALDTILKSAVSLGIDTVRLRDAQGRVQSEDIAAPFDVPLFDNSAVDGFAICGEDLRELGVKGGVRLSCSRCVAAGDSLDGLKVHSGQSIQIFTGAEIPEGTAAVVMQEDAQFEEGIVVIKAAANDGQHIRRKGSECVAGQVLVPSGTILVPGVVALIAELGKPEVTVAKQPKVGLISTGNELTSPGEPLKRGAIYDSNSYGLRAALQIAGIADVVSTRTPDDLKATTDAFQELLETCDIVVSFGGVSVGEFDLVKPVLRGLGVTTSIWGTRLKPGKPFYFGIPSSNHRCKAVFGLPGNPLSALVTAQLFLFPYLRKMQGIEHVVPGAFEAKLLKDMHKHTDRLEFVPGRLEFDGNSIGFEPTDLRGSHMLSGFSNAQALAMFEVESSHVRAGEFVKAMRIRWELNADG